MIYLLHIEPAYRHARHYLGYTKDQTADRRLTEHLTGQGSPLIRAAVAAGHSIRLVHTWPDGDRTEERRLKRRGGSARHCPICRPAHLAARRQRARRSPPEGVI